MTEIFRSHVDFQELLGEVARRGFAFEAEGVCLDFCRELVESVDSVELTRYFRQTDSICVKTEALVLRTDQDIIPVPIRLLYEKVTQRVRMSAPRCKPSLKQWLPNEITIQRFSEHDDQISRHQDFSPDRELIIIFTIEGAGPFRMYEARHSAEPTHAFETASGSIGLLIAPALDGADHRVDIRPVHSADPAHVLPRTTITFRMVVGSKPG